MGQFLAGVGLLFIAATTLVPLPQQTAASQLTPPWCLVCGDYGGVDVVNNVLLFVPLGLGLRLAGWRAGSVVAAGALLSLLIELLQWTVIRGRDASLSDLLTNTLGSWLGALMGTYRMQLLKPTAGQARRFALAGGALWLGTQLATATLLQPWAPGQTMTGVWGRSVYGRPPFRGQVISAVLSGWPLPRDSSPISPELAADIRRGRVELQLQLLSGRRPGRWSPVVEVLGPRGAVVAIETLGRDLAFQPPLRSARLKLGRPSIRLPEALPRIPGTRVQLVAGERGSTLWAEWAIGGTRHSTTQRLSPSLGWSLLTPFRYAYGKEARLITMIWLAGWLLPISFWAAQTPVGSWVRRGNLLLLLIAGLALIPWITGYGLGHGTEWLAAVVGLGAGEAGHRSAAYTEERCDSLSIKDSC